MTSSRAISVRVRTALTISADVLLRCPRRRRGSRCWVWIPAYPVDGQHDLGRGVIEVGHGFVDDRAHNPLLEPRIRRRC